MHWIVGGALSLSIVTLAAPSFAQPTSNPSTQPVTAPSTTPASVPSTQPASAPSTQPATAPVLIPPTSRPVLTPPDPVPTPPVEPPVITPPDNKEPEEFPLVERPFPEEIHAKRFQFFQLDGYFRLRADRFIKPDLGLTLSNGRDPILGLNNQPIFGLPVPLELNQQNGGINFGVDNSVYATSNLRLRLEPIFNVSESVRVRAQIDVLDNVVLGSTPGFFPDAGGIGLADGDGPDVFGITQVPLGDTIVAKRAWGEAQIPYGEIRFGRMGWHFGMGLLANDGNGINSNFGDTVDRVAITFKLADFLLTGAFDFGATGVIAEHPGVGVLGQAFDVSQTDDVEQYVVSAMKVYTRKEEEEKRKRGELALQYGLQGIYRNQQASTEFNIDVDDTNLVVLADRRANTATLDVWSRLIWKDLHLEAEAVGIFGQLSCVINAPPGQDAGSCQDPAGGQGQTDLITILAGAFAARANYSLADGQWKLGGEVGAASGDTQTPYSLALQAQTPFNPAQNATLNAFLFDRDYQVDLLLFRELLNTVTGAAYIKPTVQFKPLPPLTLSAAGIFSLALAPVDSNFGNSNAPLGGNNNTNVGPVPLGLEGDLDAEYRTEDGFFAGLSWGILFPLAGLNAEGNNGIIDAETAQTFRVRLGITF